MFIKFLVANLAGFLVGMGLAIGIIKYFAGSWFALPLGLIVGMLVSWYLPKFIRRKIFKMEY